MLKREHHEREEAMMKEMKNMLEVPPDGNLVAAEQAAVTAAEKRTTPENVEATFARTPWYQQLWSAIRRYPLPLGALVLLLVSLLLWLSGHGELANWTLLAIVLLGGIPLLWKTVQHVIHREFSVDFI